MLQLAAHNPSQIFLAARTPSKAEAAINEIKNAVPSANITSLQLDLTSLDSIKAAVDTFQSQTKRLDILMNNAGIMACPPGVTMEGYEIQFGTNHVGHALLTKLLLPTLESTAKDPSSDVRIINLSSEGHNMAPSGGIMFDKAKLDAQITWVRYGNSKLANILYSRELADRYPDITSVSIHPGIIKTDLYAASKESNIFMRYGMMFFGPLIMKDVHQGALNQLWAAVAPKNDLVNGAYYTPIGNKSRCSSYARDRTLSKELWDWTEKELSSRGY